METTEVQFDGLVGPTHNYAGLAFGNIASDANKGAVSNPRAAALQGLEKMRFVSNLGIPQCFVPPHLRPLIPELKRIGFTGATQTLLNNAYMADPALLASMYSSSFMWVANMATVAPSSDTGDHRLHMTPANLVSHYHRALEANFSHRLLAKIFHNQEKTTINNFLLPTAKMGDEAAANHMRVSTKHSDRGKHIFVYGASDLSSQKPKNYPARQTLEASTAIARLHRLKTEDCLFLQQSPHAIDQGVFHNDVIAMNCTRRMIFHEEAFVKPEVMNSFLKMTPEILTRAITSQELSVAESVSSYLFNSQLLELSGGAFALIVPNETMNHPRAYGVCQRMMDEGLIDALYPIEVRESMRNGGGPACLRLRVVMTQQEFASMHQSIILDDTKYMQLKKWIESHYRDRLSVNDLRDADFVDELHTAYEALEVIIDMPGLYRLE